MARGKTLSKLKKNNHKGRKELRKWRQKKRKQISHESFNKTKCVCLDHIRHLRAYNLCDDILCNL